MGWLSIDLEGNILSEDKDGRPVAAGDEGNLLAIVQEDFGHKIVVDLKNGFIFIDPDSYGYQNGDLEISNPKTFLVACDDTNRMHEYKHNNPTFDLARDEKGRKVHDNNGKLVTTRTDVLSDLLFRPIWYTRWTNGMPTKVIGLQTTTPDEMGTRNVQFSIILFLDGTIGISGER